MAIATPLTKIRNDPNIVYESIIAQVGDLVVMQSQQRTDMYTLKGEELTILKEFPYRVQVVVEHENRLIVDNQVFVKEHPSVPYKLVQYLQIDEQILGGCGLGYGVLVFGHLTYGRISLYIWRGTEYFYIQKNALIAAGGASRMRTISMLQKNQCCMT